LSGEEEVNDDSIEMISDFYKIDNDIEGFKEILVRLQNQYNMRC